MLGRIFGEKNMLFEVPILTTHLVTLDFLHEMRLNLQNTIQKHHINIIFET